MKKILLTLIGGLALVGVVFSFAAESSKVPSYLFVWNLTDTPIVTEVGMGGACWNSGVIPAFASKSYKPGYMCRSSADIYIFSRQKGQGSNQICEQDQISLETSQMLTITEKNGIYTCTLRQF